MVAAVSSGSLSATGAPAAPRAMISPAVDLLCIGGLSLVVSLALLGFGAVPFDKHVPAFFTYFITLAITWPHFLSSYRLLYSTRESVFRYRVASLYFPLALAAYAVFALSRVPDPTHVQLLSLVAGVYLARHYTGQTWGMMATFSHIGGTPFTALERRICQSSLSLMMLWHITWAFARGIGKVAPSLQSIADGLDARVDAVAFVSFAIGLAGLIQLTRRLGRLPPWRVVVPWLALYSWYALLRKDPTSLVVIQTSHALQYLIFPLRIEENRSQDAGQRRRIEPRRIFIWLAGLMTISLAVFAGIPTLFKLAYNDAGGAGELSIAFTSVFVSFVNIHHYFVDGCLYKLRNPAVRRDLFAHLQPANPAA